MNNTKRELSHKVLISGLAVIFSLVMVLTMISAPAVQISSNASPEVAASTGSYIPNPEINSNITWSTFYNRWSPLEYSNGTSNLTLNTDMSNIYANPISVNPSDIQANHTLTYDKMGTMTSNWTSDIIIAGAWNGGSVATTSIQDGHYIITANTSKSAASSPSYTMKVPLSTFPSTNPSYDYLTIIYGLSGTPLTGAYLQTMLGNGTSNHFLSATTQAEGNNYFSLSLAQLQKNFNYTPSFNTSGEYKASELTIQIYFNLPTTTTDSEYTMTIYGMAFTDYPLTLGENATGNIISQSGSTAHLSTLAPSFQWSSIINDGYTVSVSQSMQNPTTQQTSINNNNLIEQGTYQGYFELPTAPDLSFSNTNITLQMSLSGKQYEVANLNGISYLSSIQAKSNGTFSFGTVNPNSQNTIILEVEFTASQWNASSTAPSFWSIQGLEYYWWLGVVGLLSFIGLGSLAASHWGGTEENLKIPKGKFGR